MNQQLPCNIPPHLYVKSRHVELIIAAAMELQIAVALHHRDQFSHGHNRQTFGYEAYHWALVVMPPDDEAGRYDSYDATDSSEIDKVTWRMNNPNMDWWFRVKTDIDPQEDPKVIGRITLGITTTSRSQLKDLFASVPLPVKNSHPQQSCVTWAINAIAALQKDGIVPDFNVGEFKDKALGYADERMGGGNDKLVRYADLLA